MNIGTLYATLGVDTAGLLQAEQRMKQFQQNTQRSFESIQKEVDNTGKSMRSLGMQMSTYLSLPIILAGKKIENTFMNYETALAHITGLTGTAAETTAQWDIELRKLGSAMGQKPQELADALYFIASSGLDDAYSMDVLTKSALAATAGLGQVKDIADLVTGAMVAYGEENLSAQRTVDVLTAAVREGKAEATDMAHAIGFVIPNAAQLGVTFDQVAATLAAMTTVNIKTNTAAWYLRQILMSLLKPSQQAEDALSSMGTSSAHLRDVLKGQNGLLNALGEINDLTIRFGEDAVAKVFPEVRELTGFFAVMGENLENNKIIFDLVNDSAGDTQDAFNVISETLRFQLNRALSDLNNAMIEVGASMKDDLINILNSLQKKLQQLAEWWKNLSERQQQFILRIAALIAAMGPILIITGGLISIFSRLIIVVKGLVSIFGTLMIAMQASPFIMASVVSMLAVLATHYLFLSKNIEKVTKAQQDLNDLQQSGKELTIGDQRKNIERAMTIYKELNKRQLALLKDRIQSQIEAEEDYSVKVLQEHKNFNDSVLYLQEQLQKQQEEYDEKYKEGKLISQKDLGEKLRLEKEINNKQSMIDERIRQVEEINNEEYFNKQRLQIMEDYLKQVKQRQEELAKIEEERTKGGTGNKGYTEAQKEAIDALAKKEELLLKLENALGKEFDYNAESLKLYQETLQKFIEVGLSETDTNYQSVIEKFKEFNSKTKFSISLFEELTKKLDGLKALGDLLNIDYGADQLNAYKDSLKKMIEQGYASGEFVTYLTQEIKKLESQYGETALAQKELNTQWERVGLGLSKSVADQYDIISQKIQLVGQQIDLIKTKPLITEEDINRLQLLNQQLVNYNAQLDLLKNQEQIFNIMADSVVSMTQAMGEALVSGASAFDVFFTTILESVQQVIALLLKQAIVALYATGATKGLVGLIASSIGVSAMLAMYKRSAADANNAAKMAQGGQVPLGYPNDTYPALLSSNEVVIPPKKLDNLLQTGNMEINVVIEGVAKGEDIYYSVKQVEKRYKNNF